VAQTDATSTVFLVACGPDWNSSAGQHSVAAEPIDYQEAAVCKVSSCNSTLQCSQVQPEPLATVVPCAFWTWTCHDEQPWDVMNTKQLSC
jgi:hypothetical protein